MKTNKLIPIALLALLSATAFATPRDTQVYQQTDEDEQFYYAIPHSATVDEFQMWDGTNHIIKAAAFSNNDFWHAGGVLKLGVNRARAQTNTSGVYVWTFPTAFAGGITPIVSVAVEDATTTNMWNHQITALSNTGLTLQLTKTTDVTILGIHVLGVASTPQAYVHLTATAPSP